MNPLDLPGPAFLGFYVVLLLAVLALGAWLRWFLRQPGDEPSLETRDLSPYHIAYLGGGEDQAVDAAVAKLVHASTLTLDPGSRELKPSGKGLPADAAPLERAVYAAAESRDTVEIAAVRSSASRHLVPVRQRLQDLGLLVAGDLAGTARWLPCGLVLLVPLLGVVKIFVGLSRHRPIAILLVLVIGSVILALAGFARSVHRSRRGDRALAELKEVNAALGVQAGRRVEQLADNDLVLALALFGVGILTGGPLASLRTALKPPSAGDGGGGDGGGCGGGGCGGGCGGCSG